MFLPCSMVILIFSLQLTWADNGTQFYKYIDKNNVTVYTDKPPEGIDAEPVQVKDLQTYKALQYDSNDKKTQENNPSTSSIDRSKYEVLIKKPQPDETLWTAGEVEVQIELAAELVDTDYYELHLDNAVIATDTKSNTFILKNVDRGEKRLFVRIMDKNKNAVYKSEEVTFYVKRNVPPVINN